MIAIAFESVVKLVAFVLVGVFCTFELYDGFGNLFALARQDPKVASVFSADFSQWGLATQLVLASLAIICCLLYTSPSPRDRQKSRMPSSA